MKNSTRYSLPVLLLLFATAVCAQETKPHPIDKAYDICTEKNPTTGELVECAETAYKKWDLELNKNYRALMRRLKPAGKQLLKTSQLSWITHRDNEFKLIDSLYDELQGTMYIPMRYDEKMQVVKRRAMALSDHLDILNESEP
jgi:uncharacterized protein YecT (DUF1311 family)